MSSNESPKKKDFWLTPTPLIGVIVLIGIISLLTSETDRPVPAEIINTRNMSKSIALACLFYQAEYKKLPPSSDNHALVNTLRGDNPRRMEFIILRPKDINSGQQVIDAWNSPFRIKFETDGKVQVISAGPDKKFDTPDDMASTPMP